MTEIVGDEHKGVASELRDILSLYAQNEDLISIGAYKAGTNPRLDNAISRIQKINDFLMQRTGESFTMEQTVKTMRQILR